MAPKQGGFIRVLVAFDGSEVSFRAVDRAARIARQDGAELIALHVVSSFEVPGGLADYYDGARRNAKKRMKDAEAIAMKHGVGIKSEVIVGAYSVVDGYLDTPRHNRSTLS